MTQAASTKRGRPLGSSPSGRERLLRAARAEFGDRGYGATTVDHLVAAAQVNPPTLYHHFGNKSGLFVAAARHAYDEVLAAFRAKLPRPASIAFDVSVATILDVSIETMRRNPDLAKLFLVIQFELPRQPGLKAELHTTLREFRGFFEEIAVTAPSHLAANESERRDLARALIAIINGLNGEALLLRRPADFPKLVERMGALIQRH
jgi:AcrR family transcriptional regulator